VQPNKKFRIGYFADGPWSHNAFRLLEKDEEIEIAFIVPRIDTNDNTLKFFAQEYGIDYLHPVKINSVEFYEKAASYDCDLFVSMSFNQIFRKPIIELPRLNTINCHAGKLPFYRGRNVLNWAIINDEKEFGVTVHFVDQGIDTGDIILQQCFPITDEDNYYSLLKIAYKECASLLFDAVKQIQNNSYKVIKQHQIHSVGFYCGRRGPGDEVIDWNTNSRQVFNFIRALSKPGPIAETYLKGEIIKINKARMIDNAPSYINIPGQLLSKTKNGFLVKTKNSFIEISQIKSSLKLRVGDKLGQ